jgi:hypothetical protein
LRREKERNMNFTYQDRTWKWCAFPASKQTIYSENYKAFVVCEENWKRMMKETLDSVTFSLFPL